MYNEKVLAILTKALKDEYTSSLIYTKMGNAVRGLNSTELASELLKHADEEFGHAKEIVDYLAKHGMDGDIVYDVDLDRINEDLDTIEIIVRVTQDLEKDAIETYHTLLQLAKEKGDVETCKFAKHLMIAEMGHFDDLARFTQQTRGFMTGAAAIPVDSDWAEDRYSDMIRL